MSDSLRNSTRAKKPPRYLQMEDSQYGLYSGGRNPDTKVRESRTQQNKSNPQELTQIAKLLIKLITNSNQKAKSIQRVDLSEAPQLDNTPNRKTRNKTTIPAQKTLKSSQTALDDLNVSSKNPPNGGQQPSEFSKASSKVHSKREDLMKRGSLGMSASMQSDLSYHAMLRQHIRAALPGSKNLSAETLMKLGIPAKEVFQQKKVKEDEQKKVGITVQPQRVTAREQQKPFKRQNYHVAIAYHIFLNSKKTGPSPSLRDIDPTYNARKLREKFNKQ